MRILNIGGGRAVPVSRVESVSRDFATETLGWLVTLTDGSAERVSRQSLMAAFGEFHTVHQDVRILTFHAFESDLSVGVGDFGPATHMVTCPFPCMPTAFIGPGLNLDDIENETWKEDGAVGSLIYRVGEDCFDAHTMLRAARSMEEVEAELLGAADDVRRLREANVKGVAGVADD